jgi:hypothetical protein
VPSFVFVAVFTSALDPLPVLAAAAGWAGAGAGALLDELLPHAASSRDAARVGKRNLIDLGTV